MTRSSGLHLAFGVSWPDLIDGVRSLDPLLRARGTSWAATGAVAAELGAPLLTNVGFADVNVDAPTMAALEATSRAVGLRPVEGGRLVFRPMPIAWTERSRQLLDGVYVAPWPRVYVDLHTLGVRGEEAAEHWRDHHLEREVTRSRRGRAAAEAAPRRRPRWFGLCTTTDHVPSSSCSGGLVPEMLCSTSEFTHAGTTDIDWYDIAFVLIHNDLGGAATAATRVIEVFGDELGGVIQTQVDELHANFAAPAAQGPQAYAIGMLSDHRDLDRRTLSADAIAAVDEFHRRLTRHTEAR